ncbi:MAG: hypothetical protein EOO88_18215 [Pedobacter sp.]|nr:MAG: hypothetical protein EOO88_18215 [Pedobacter sp.]
MMLHYQSLDTSTFNVLHELMANPTLKEAGFVLCGGTALTLQLGHRMSTDIDLFSPLNVTAPKMKSYMEKTFGDRLDITSMGDLGIRGFLDGVKLDMIKFPYPMKHSPLEVNGLRVIGLDDASAMKLHAAANRGARRDYVDLAELLQKMPFERILINYQNQFNPSPQALEHTRRAITFFDDAERTTTAIDMLNGRRWETTKQIIRQSVANPRHIQLLPPPKPLLAANPHQQGILTVSNSTPALPVTFHQKGTTTKPRQSPKH